MMQIKLSSISKIYEGRGYSVPALTDINLEIKKGEMIGIMGASGSGKSTLLNILGTLDRPTTGEYYLNDKDISKYSSKMLADVRNKSFGFVLQDFALVERYSVLHNVKLPLYYSDLPKKCYNERVMDVLKQLGISDKHKMLPMEISGGQRQRVAIARALVNEPEIILADEPTGALDSSTSKEIMRIFTEIKSKNKTIIIVTHDHHIASYCDRILHISDGKIEA